MDILAHIEAGRPDQPRTLCWRQRRGESTWWAVRDGGLKYVRHAKAGQTEEHLFDLTQDEGESRDLIAARPDDASRLKALLAAWEKEVRAPR
jgi:hypothetical protein